MTIENLTHDALEELHLKLAKAAPGSKEFETITSAIQMLTESEIKMLSEDSKLEFEKTKLQQEQEIENKKMKSEKTKTILETVSKIICGVAGTVGSIFLVAFTFANEREVPVTTILGRKSITDALNIFKKGK